MAMSTTAKLLTSVGLGVGSAILVNGVMRHQIDALYPMDAAEDIRGKPNPWFRYAPWISTAGPIAVALAIWKLADWGDDAALVALLAGLGASVAVPANDYVLTNLRKVPVTTIPMDVAVGGLRGAGTVHQMTAAGR
jgi:hypothetical protein